MYECYPGSVSCATSTLNVSLYAAKASSLEAKSTEWQGMYHSAQHNHTQEKSKLVLCNSPSTQSSYCWLLVYVHTYVYLLYVCMYVHACIRHGRTEPYVAMYVCTFIPYLIFKCLLVLCVRTTHIRIILYTHGSPVGDCRTSIYVHVHMWQLLLCVLTT